MSMSGKEGLVTEGKGPLGEADGCLERVGKLLERYVREGGGSMDRS